MFKPPTIARYCILLGQTDSAAFWRVVMPGEKVYYAVCDRKGKPVRATRMNYHTAEALFQSLREEDAIKKP